ncbi:response regulator [Accumulibacter sp.]|uniref:response regulator transcription factor n=1 Tax=Accumulibacter sp. TaxID=2053492 RepID=UPI0025E13C0B|nr:response regulator [Accumulibacter sp.]MCM8613526.1 response regulator [Accumulibacter sp.]MCM8637159.1 response regulator [Accumulibacter sp.]MCM8640777.1 response regulator [Accumulibacter sp.]
MEAPKVVRIGQEAFLGFSHALLPRLMTASGKQTVCIVDDDAQIRRFLSEVLTSIGLVAEEYASGEDFMRRWQPARAACVLLDIRMPRITGPEIHDWLREREPHLPVIFLTGHADVTTAVRAMRLGAFDVIEKPFNVQQLIERVNQALRRVAEAAAATAGNGGWQQALTTREKEVLAGIIDGKRSKVIAAELGISERTVESHRASIMAKAGAGTAAQLVAMAIGKRPPG